MADKWQRFLKLTVTCWAAGFAVRMVRRYGFRQCVLWPLNPREVALARNGDVDGLLRIAAESPAREGMYPVRAIVAFLLGGIEDPRAQDALLSLLFDRQAEVRGGAAVGLAQSGVAVAGEVVEAALRDTNADVRRAVLRGAARHGWPMKPAQVLEIARNDPERWVRSVAVRTLKQVRDPEVARTLEEIAKTDELLVALNATSSLRGVRDADGGVPLQRLSTSAPSRLRRVDARLELWQAERAAH